VMAIIQGEVLNPLIGLIAEVSPRNRFLQAKGVVGLGISARVQSSIYVNRLTLLSLCASGSLR
jgi:hypothetical protein